MPPLRALGTITIERIGTSLKGQSAAPINATPETLATPVDLRLIGKPIVKTSDR